VLVIEHTAVVLYIYKSCLQLCREVLPPMWNTWIKKEELKYGLKLVLKNPVMDFPPTSRL